MCHTWRAFSDCRSFKAFWCRWYDAALLVDPLEGARCRRERVRGGRGKRRIFALNCSASMYTRTPVQTVAVYHTSTKCRRKLNLGTKNECVAITVVIEVTIWWARLAASRWPGSKSTMSNRTRDQDTLGNLWGPCLASWDWSQECYILVISHRFITGSVSPRPFAHACSSAFASFAAAFSC